MSLEACAISKSYGGFQVLDGADGTRIRRG